LLAGVELVLYGGGDFGFEDVTNGSSYSIYIILASIP